MPYPKEIAVGETLAGPLSRLLCLMVGCCPWLPIIVLAYLQWRMKSIGGKKLT